MLKILTWTYSAQISILPTNSQTCSTLQELISSLCAWHRLDAVDELWVVHASSLFDLNWLELIVADCDKIGLMLWSDDGELKRIFFTDVGVFELLKSNGVVVICSTTLDGLGGRFGIVKPAVEKFGEKLYFRFDAPAVLLVFEPVPPTLALGDVFCGLWLRFDCLAAVFKSFWVSASFAARACSFLKK